jgi:formyltetrahydrofolate-dependent phosphoribosylglycinamide formyltransferase
MPSALPVGVLVSGGGTTLLNLIDQQRAGRLEVDFRLVIASRECAGADHAREAGIATRVIQARSFASAAAYSEGLFDALRRAEVELVVLGGFLSRIVIPEDFEGRVLNIHPALIPSFCGTGMYGHYVHESVLARGCKVSGCTVHFCDNEYDHGPIVLQRCVPVLDDDTPDTLQTRVFEEECEAYPEAIRLYAARRLKIDGRRVRVLPAAT